MSSQLGKTFVSWREDARKELRAALPAPGTHGGATVTPAVRSASVLRSARRLAIRFAGVERGHTGRPLGRIRISRIGLSTIVVENTDYWGSLSKARAATGRSRAGRDDRHRRSPHIRRALPPHRQHPRRRSSSRPTARSTASCGTDRRQRRLVDHAEVGFDELVLSACHPLQREPPLCRVRLASVEAPRARDAVRVGPARGDDLGVGPSARGRSGRPSPRSPARRRRSARAPGHPPRRRGRADARDPRRVAQPCRP